MVERAMIHTDGSCLGNPGPGGYGIVVEQGGHRQEINGGFRHTTNNRMELIATIIGLRSLDQPHSVVVYSDSKYVVDGMNKGWARKWKTNNWKKGKGGKASNPDLWEQLLDLCDKHDVMFRWVRGHSGDVENERCDHLAVEAAYWRDLPVDHGYKKG